MSRPVTHRYLDPLDQVWLATARAIGLRVERSSDVYAASDGRGQLAIGRGDSLDPDDCLAQMIFHELCHSLVEGPAAFDRADWGLDNTSDSDDWREHACLRLQAQLAARFGLRRVLAPTTEFRGFYDDLPLDPLEPRHERSVQAAIRALARVDVPPWGPHLTNALKATAAIAGHAAAVAGLAASEPLDSLWQLVEPPAPPHPTGFAAALDSDPSRRCGTCAWHYLGGRGTAVARCRQAGDQRVQPDWPACERWEPVLDCQDCGACCREAYDSVTISRRDPVRRVHPELVVDRGRYLELARTGSRCAALETPPNAPMRFGCRIYANRPAPCRGFERGSDNCLTARRRVAMSR